MIQIYISEEHLPCPIYRDTEPSSRTQVHFPGWNDLYFKKEEYLEMIPHNDPTMREIDDKVFMNIYKSCLHIVATREPVFPCVDAIE
jgi:hypothetical protein